MNQKLVEVKNLKKHFKVGKKQLKAVDDVTFEIYQGETLGLVGESGCGKSTVGRTILNLYSATSGDIIYDGVNLQNGLEKKDKKLYQQKMQMIFQDPYSSLDPRMTVMDIIREGIKVHRPNMSMKEQQNIVYELLELVGLNKNHAKRFSHEFSGGQRQRIGIARALAVNPEFIIADEPIAALDVSIQAQVVNLLRELQEKRGLTYLFIAHDLSMVKYISDRVAVMYLGNMVELAGSDELYDEPLHPYTKALMSAVPIPDPDIELKRERIILEGDIPSPIDPPSGCRFRTRCPLAIDLCARQVPEWRQVRKDHYVACHVVE